MRVNPAERLASHVVRTMAEMTGGRPGQWRMVGEVAERLQLSEGVAERAVALAIEKGWAEERVHSICLTDAGRRHVT